jgi:hypothetical protein
MHVESVKKALRQHNRMSERKKAVLSVSENAAFMVGQRQRNVVKMPAGNYLKGHAA